MDKQIVERGTLLKVLDHGYVRLVDYMGKDSDIVEAARMSTDKGFISWDPYKRCKDCLKVVALDAPEEGPCIQPVINSKTQEKTGVAEFKTHSWERQVNGDLGMLDTLWRKKHATPFEMGELVIEVQAPLFVFREWHRHRTQSYNEFSARYAVMPNIHYLPEATRIQKQSTANKQGSAEAFDYDFAKEIIEGLSREQQDVYDNYDGMVDDGLAREIARINTPVSRYSKMRAKGNIRNWFQFLNLRMRPDAQFEIRQYANEVAKIIGWLWPKAYGFFEEYDLYGAHFSRTELKAIRIFIEGALSGNWTGTDKDWEKLGLSGTKLKEFKDKLSNGGDKILS